MNNKIHQEPGSFSMKVLFKIDQCKENIFYLSYEGCSKYDHFLKISQRF